MSQLLSPATARSEASPNADHEIDTSQTPNSLEKKRERDKNSQRRKRQREREYITNLEDKVRLLEDQLASSHDSAHVMQQLPTPRYALVHDDQLPADDASLSQRSPSTVVTPSAFPISALLSNDSLEVVSNEHAAEVIATVPLRTLDSLLATPIWLRRPLHKWAPSPGGRPWSRGVRLASFFQETQSCPEIVSVCTPRPKVIDILFGGSKNLLANMIVAEVAKEALLLPEKFATSWALYVYCRWLLWPSEESWSHLFKYIRPTARQLVVEHHWCIDLVVWPKIRENMINNYVGHDIEVAMGLFLCSSRIRGFFNSNIITRQNDGELELDEEFYQQFTDPNGWGLLERFWTEYPDLVEGMDPSVMIREEQLLNK